MLGPLVFFLDRYGLIVLQKLSDFVPPTRVHSASLPDAKHKVRRLRFVRPPDKSALLKIIFLISQPKHMLPVLKRTVAMILFF